MHESSMLRMKWFASKYLDSSRKLKILDVGAYDVNGCYKEIFTSKGHDYVGLDMEEGPNVDITPQSAYVWDEIEEGKYDVVISGQALEHIEFFWVTFEEIIRVTKKEGLICIIAPKGFEEHRYPVDCWRFLTDGMIAIARLYMLEIIHTHTNCAPSIDEKEWYSKDCADSMLIARKPYEGVATKINLKEYKCTPGDHKKLMQNFVPYENYRTKELEIEKPKNKNTATARFFKKLLRWDK